MLWRWTNRRGYALTFEAGGPADLAAAALDAAITARVETVHRYHEGGSGEDRLRYRRLELHVHCPACGRWHRPFLGYAGAGRILAVLPGREVTVGRGPLTRHGEDDVALCRRRAAAWWAGAADAVEHCRQVGALAQHARRDVEGR